MPQHRTLDDRTLPPATRPWTVSDVMHRGLLSCPPDTPLTEVAYLMLEHRIHAVVVEGAHRAAGGMERPTWGIVSDLDVVSRIGVAEARTAGDMAATPLIVVDPREDLEEAARLMHDYDVHHVIVVEPVDRRPIGVLSTLDLVAAITAGGV